MAGAGENPARWLASEEDAAFDTPTSAIRCRQVHIDGLPGTDLQKRAASVALTGAHCLGSGSDAPSVGSSAGFGGGSDEDAGESSSGLTVSTSSPDDETDATLYLPAHVVARRTRLSLSTCKPCTPRTPAADAVRISRDVAPMLARPTVPSISAVIAARLLKKPTARQPRASPTRRAAPVEPHASSCSSDVSEQTSTTQPAAPAAMPYAYLTAPRGHSRVTRRDCKSTCFTSASSPL